MLDLLKFLSEAQKKWNSCNVSCLFKDMNVDVLISGLKKEKP